MRHSAGTGALTTEIQEHDTLVRAAISRELDTSKKFDVLLPVKEGVLSKAVVDSRRAQPWKMANGRKHVRGRHLAKDYRDPDLKEGLVATRGRVS